MPETFEERQAQHVGFVGKNSCFVPFLLIPLRFAVRMDFLDALVHDVFDQLSCTSNLFDSFVDLVRCPWLAKCTL